jgi:adenosylcobyric acid synthase
VLGLCGGYQMLEPEKTVGEADGFSLAFDAPVHGYEIHLGRTGGPDCARPLVEIGGKPDGAISGNGRIMGTYLHGLFGSTEFRRAFLGTLGVEGGAFDHRRKVEEALDAIADHLERSLDVDGLLGTAR